MAVQFATLAAFPGYRVGDDGSVWSCRVRSGFGTWESSDQWRRIAIATLDTGYLKVGLWRDGKYYQRLLHRLVLEAFVGPCPDGKEGAHLNGVKADCRLDNLEWKTKKGNAADRTTHGTQSRGTRHYHAKLTEEIAAEVRRRHDSGESRKSIGIAMSLSKSTVSRILRHESYV